MVGQNIQTSSSLSTRRFVGWLDAGPMSTPVNLKTYRWWRCIHPKCSKTKRCLCRGQSIIAIITSPNPNFTSSMTPSLSLVHQRLQGGWCCPIYNIFRTFCHEYNLFSNLFFVGLKLLLITTFHFEHYHPLSNWVGPTICKEGARNGEEERLKWGVLNNNKFITNTPTVKKRNGKRLFFAKSCRRIHISYLLFHCGVSI